MSSMLLLVLLINLAVSTGELYGPRNVNDSIAIVGAGPTGIHMAMLLRQKGFKDITIYEMRNDNGVGSSRSHRGIPFHANSMFSMAAGEFKSLIDNYLTVDDYFRMPEPVIWSKIKGGDLVQMSFIEYMIENAKQILSTDQDAAARQLILDNMSSYISRFNSLFSEGLKYEMLHNPPYPERFDIYGSVKDFLERFNMESLLPIFVLHLSAKGFGHPSEIPALIGLMHVSNTLMTTYRQSVVNGVESPDLRQYVLKEGFEKLFTRIMADNAITIANLKHVDRIQRADFNHNTAMTLRWRNVDGTTSMKKFDFVIWVPHLKNALEALSWDRLSSVNVGYSTEEYQNFLRVMNNKLYKHVAIVDSINITQGRSPINIFMDALSCMGDSCGVAQLLDTYAIQQQFNSSYYQSGNASINADNSEFRSMMAVYFTSQSNSHPSTQLNVNILSNLNPKNVSSQLLSSMPVNIHFSWRDVANDMLSRVMEMQGKYGMWYTGDSVTGGDQLGQLAYNKYLVDNMREPLQDGKGSGGSGNVIT